MVAGAPAMCGPLHVAWWEYGSVTSVAVAFKFRHVPFARDLSPEVRRDRVAIVLGIVSIILVAVALRLVRAPLESATNYRIKLLGPSRILPRYPVILILACYENLHQTRGDTVRRHRYIRIRSRNPHLSPDGSHVGLHRVCSTPDSGQ